MFNRKSSYALNKKDTNAIVYIHLRTSRVL